MKKVIFTILVSLMMNAEARECSVYGISDSPQKLNCTFRGFKLALRCNGGTYFLNTSKVKVAYHLEVEDGPVPLVFKSADMELTVEIQDKIDIKAELVKNNRTLRGTCL